VELRLIRPSSRLSDPEIKLTTGLELTRRLLRIFVSDGHSAPAINRHVERVFNPDRKDAHWGKRKLKRDT
jgi:hypothetical protein